MIGQKLKKLRLGNSLFQRELASLLEVCRSQISRYETNRDNLSNEKLNIICDLFNVEKNYFLGNK